MPTNWLTVDDQAFLLEMWPDVVNVDEEVLEAILTAAQEACIAYAPALPADADVPAGYRLAQAMQARNIANASLAAPGSGGGVAGDGFGITVYPLDWMVKQLLRPQVGGVGPIV